MAKPPKPTTTPTSKTRRVIEVNREDNNFQRADVLKRNREKRFRYGQFLVEGVSQISLALQNGWGFNAVLYSSERPLSRWAADIVEKAANADQLVLTPPLLAKLSEKDEPSELLAIIEMKKCGTEILPVRSDGLVLAFDRPASPGNLGSSLRSADAFGAQGIIVTGHAVDIYDPFVVRGSMGALFALPVATAPSHEAVATWVTQARSQGIPFQVIGTSGKATDTIHAVDFRVPTVLVLGNETVGMSKGYWDICTQVVKIPIGGCLSSLNVSCAASVMLYEASRQRGAAA